MSPALGTPGSTAIAGNAAAPERRTEGSGRTDTPQTPIPAPPLPPGPEGFQSLGDGTAGHCADGVCALPGAAEPTPAEG